MKVLLFITIFFYWTVNSFAQTQSQIPQPASIGTYGQQHLPQQNNPHPIPYPSPNSDPQQRQRKYHQFIMQETQGQQQQARSRQLVDEAILIMESSTIHYELPEKPQTMGQEYYHQAFDELKAMLKGEQPLDLKKAVFFSENAFFKNEMDYELYSTTIQNMVKHCNLALKQGGFDANDPLAKLMILHKFMSDTLSVKHSGSEQVITTYPMKYDFEDFRGRNDPTKLMVSKLMHTTTGQCHSMPLLYLILCQEMGVEAHLAFAPDHSYIKFQDKLGNWYNLELTNGVITSDQFIMQSGFIKAEAVQNKLYMRPLSMKETVAQTVSDLATYYVKQHGFDDFQLQCADLMKPYQKVEHRSLILEANYYSVLFNHVLDQYKDRKAPKAVVDADEKAMAILKERNTRYQAIDALGYEEMPDDVYQRWLNSLNEAQEQQKHRQNLLRINNMLEVK